MSKDSKFVVIKSMAWYTISNFVVKAITFLTVPLFSRMMSQTEFGDYSNFILWLTLLSTVVSFNLYASVNRAYLDYKTDIDKYCSSILFWGSVTTVVFFIIIFFNNNFFCDFFMLDNREIVILFFYMLFQPAMDIYQARQRVSYQYKKSVFVSVVFSISTTVVSVLMVSYCIDKYWGRVLGYVVPSILVFIFLYTGIMKNGKNIDVSYFKYAFLFSWPFIPHLLANNLLSASDRILIKRYCGSECNAIYSIAVSCMSIATILMSSLNSSVSPWLFSQLKDKNYFSIKKITRPYVTLFGVVVFLVLLISPELILIIGDNQYSSAKYDIIPLLVSVFFQFCYCMYVNIEQYSKKTWAIATGTAIAAAVNILLNYLLIPRYGFHVAGYTTLVGYIVLFFVHYSFTRIIGYKNIYDDKYIFICMIIAIASLVLVVSIVDFLFIRLLVFIITMVLFVLWLLNNRKQLRELIKKDE